MKVRLYLNITIDVDTDRHPHELAEGLAREVEKELKEQMGEDLSGHLPVIDTDIDWDA